MKTLNTLKWLLWCVILVLNLSLLVLGAADYCTDMTATPPKCSAGAVPRAVEVQLDSYNTQVNNVVAITDQDEYVYSMVSIASMIKILKSSRKGDVVWELTINDSCSASSLAYGKSISFALDGSILLAGWFDTKEPTCIKTYMLSSETSQNNRRVPFFAYISSSDGSTISVTSLERNFPDASILHVDADVKNKRALRLVMQMSKMYYLAHYIDGQMALKSLIASCANPSNCNIVGFGYSSTFDRLLVTLYESDGFQFSFKVDRPNLSAQQSGIYLLQLNPVDGSVLLLERIFHSTLSKMSLPKIVLNPVGRLHLLISCEGGCYIKEIYTQASVYLLKYNFISGQVEHFPGFISVPSSVKIQHIALDRDLTIYVAVTGLNSFTIVDGYSRQSIFGAVTVLCKFRYSDGKILWANVISNDRSSDNFFISPSSVMVNKRNLVEEAIPVIFTQTSGSTTNIQITGFYPTYGNYIDSVSSTLIGGTGGSIVKTTSDKVTAILFKKQTGALSAIGFKFRSQTAFLGSIDTYSSSYFEYNLSNDEYITSISSCSAGTFYYTVEWIQIVTNKKTFSNGNAACGNTRKDIVPYGYELSGFEIKSGSYIDSIRFFYNYPAYSCISGKEGYRCESNTCFDLPSSDPLVCSGKGKCTDMNSCSCATGYYGAACEKKVYCSGIAFDVNGVCSGHGDCTSTDKCTCKAGWGGNNCQDIYCDGIIQSNSGVCSGHGKCIGPNNCSCNEGYYGTKCNTFTCGGLINSNINVCSKHGSCLDYNNCSCTGNYFGSTCEQHACGGINSNSSLVCTGRGMCTSPNRCICRTHSKGDNCETCDNGFYGNQCEKWNCGGIEKSSPNVCGGRGACIAPDNCICNLRSFGKFCETCDNGYFGDRCEQWTCGGVNNTAENVCNHRGKCQSYNNCQCIDRSYGETCEKCFGPYSGPLCSVCQGHLENDPACLNFVIGDPIFSTVFDFNGYYEIVKIKAVSISPSSIGGLTCQKLFNNVNDLGTDLTCWIYDITTIANTKVYDLRAQTRYGTMSPSQPIQFNIMWASNATANYVPLNLDVSNFNRDNKIYLGLNTTEINRCFDTPILLSYAQPERRSYFTSVQWKINNDEIASNPLIEEAFKSTNLVLKFPFVPEILSYESINITVNFVSAFGKPKNETFILRLSKPFPIPKTFPTKSITFLNTDNIRISLREYFEHSECLNQGIIPTYSVPRYPDQYFYAFLTSDSIIVYGMMFLNSETMKIVFSNGAVIPIRIQIMPPTPNIVESIIFYDGLQVPKITISCTDPYGGIGGRKIYYSLERGNSVLASYSNIQTPLSIPISDITSTTTVNFMLLCSCNFESQATFVKAVTFIDESQESTLNPCSIIATSLKTPMGNNIIPYSDNDEVYNLEVVTSTSNCPLSIKIASSHDSNELVSTTLTSTYSVVPITFNSDNFAGTTVTLISATRTSTYTLYISFQSKLMNRLDNCQVSPSNIEIGITKATLSCSTDLSIPGKLELYHEGVLVGKSSSFPILFTTSKSGQSFKVIFYNPLGGKITKDITLSKPLTFSVKSLLDSNFVENIASQFSNNAYNSENCDYVASMLSNIEKAPESIKNQIEELVPKALKSTINLIESVLTSAPFSTTSLLKNLNQAITLSNPVYLTGSNINGLTGIIGKFIAVIKSSNKWESEYSTAISGILLNLSPKITEATTISIVSTISMTAITTSTQSTFKTTDFFPSQKPSNLATMNALKSTQVSLNSKSITSSNKVPLVSFQLSPHKTSAQGNEEIKITHALFKFPSMTTRTITNSTKDYISKLSIYSVQKLEGGVTLSIPLSFYAPPFHPLVKQTFRCITVKDMKTFAYESTCRYTSNEQQSIAELGTTVTVVSCSCDVSYADGSSMFVTADYLEDDSAYQASISSTIAGVTVSLLLIFIVVIVVVIIVIIVIFVFRYLRNKKNQEPTTQPIPYAPQPSSSTLNASTNDFINFSMNTDYEMNQINLQRSASPSTGMTIPQFGFNSSTFAEFKGDSIPVQPTSI